MIVGIGKAEMALNDEKRCRSNMGKLGITGLCPLRVLSVMRELQTRFASLSSPQRHDDARSPPLRACCAHAENDQATRRSADKRNEVLPTQVPQKT
jgi:hypothetical protein